jgi:hypothetical protein
MQEEPVKLPPGEMEHRRRRFHVGALLALIAVLLGGAAGLAYFYYYPSQLPKAQPIPFSHHFHVMDKRISCLMCHNGAVKTARSGVPPVETCMLCHKRIIVSYPWIVRLKEYYDQRRPIPWAHVNNRVPEFVYFSHQRHVRVGFDCGRCHGNVAEMDRLFTPVAFQMGFCVQCHRDNNYSVDCLVCHR